MRVIHISITFLYGIHPSAAARLYTAWRGFPDVPFWVGLPSPEDRNATKNQGNRLTSIPAATFLNDPQHPGCWEFLGHFNHFHQQKEKKPNKPRLAVATAKRSSIIVKTLAWASLDQLLCNLISHASLGTAITWLLQNDRCRMSPESLIESSVVLATRLLDAVSRSWANSIADEIEVLISSLWV